MRSKGWAPSNDLVEDVTSFLEMLAEDGDEDAKVLAGRMRESRANGQLTFCSHDETITLLDVLGPDRIVCKLCGMSRAP